MRPGLPSLSSVATGSTVSIVDTQLAPDERAWLSAVGIEAGDVVSVLRRAAFGGPLHIRTRSGAEFAIAEELAERIQIRSLELVT